MQRSFRTQRAEVIVERTTRLLIAYHRVVGKRAYMVALHVGSLCLVLLNAVLTFLRSNDLSSFLTLFRFKEIRTQSTDSDQVFLYVTRVKLEKTALFQAIEATF